MKRYILIIDDDEAEMQIFSAALNEINKPMSCIQSANASAAMSVINYLVPDYIFLNLGMSGIDIFECLEEIKKIETLCNVPVILYSTSADESILKKATQTGITAYIKKPKKVSELARVLSEIFSLNTHFTNARLQEGKSN